MKKKRKEQKTFTKIWLEIIIVIALIDCQLPFVLAFLGKEQIAETLGGLFITEIVAVFLVYCAKSFFETKEAEKTRLKEIELGLKEETENES